jgi:hypothetical protein
MEAAADRLTGTAGPDVHKAYAAVGETLWWVTILDDLLRDELGPSHKKARRRESVHRHLLGMRYARNRIAHHWDVIEFVVPGSSTQSPSEYFDSPGYWVWIDIPRKWVGQGSGNEQHYHEVLSGQLVQATLTHTLTFLRVQVLYALEKLRESPHR